MRKLIDLMRKPIVPWLIVVICIAISAAAYAEAEKQADRNSELIAELERNAEADQQAIAERRDEACFGSESLHLQEIRDLERTFDLYADPPPTLASLVTNPLILDSLKDQIRAAQKDGDQYGVFVGSYCDEPGFGLPEPDPVVPDTPPSIVALLEGA